MAKIISLFVGFLLGTGECDLIGYNRLGNNVHSHLRYRGGNQIPHGKTARREISNEQYQIFRWMLNNEDLSTAAKLEWVPENGLNNGTKRRNSRLNQYKRFMSIY